MGLYYLQSRYYNPEIGRFINADDLGLLPASVLSGNIPATNLFSYCFNNPANYQDKSGSFGTPIQWAMSAVGAIAGWYFGDYVEKMFGYSSGAKYWMIRAGVVIGGSVIGWFAGASMKSVAVSFLKSNPSILAKMPGAVKWFLGLGSASALSSYSVAQLISSATRVGSALKSDIYHRAASWLTTTQLSRGKAFYINSGRRILFQVYGELNGKNGIFEYIIDESGHICHQLFKSGGVINGIPN